MFTFTLVRLCQHVVAMYDKGRRIILPTRATDTIIVYNIDTRNIVLLVCLKRRLAFGVYTMTVRIRTVFKPLSYNYNRNPSAISSEIIFRKYGNGRVVTIVIIIQKVTSLFCWTLIDGCSANKKDLTRSSICHFLCCIKDKIIKHVSNSK